MSHGDPDETDGAGDSSDDPNEPEEIRQRWQKRLEDKRADLEDVEGEKRAELVEELNDLEQTLVERGLLAEEERRDYTTPTDDESADGDGVPVSVGHDDGSSADDSGGDDTTDAGGRGSGRSTQPGQSTTPGAIWQLPGSLLRAITPQQTGVSGGSTSTRSSADQDEETESTDDPSTTDSADPTDGPSATDPTNDPSTADPTDGPSTTDSADPTDDPSTTDSADDTEPDDGGTTADAADDGGESTDETAEFVDRNTVAAVEATVDDLENDLHDLERQFTEYKRRNERKHDEIRKYSAESLAQNMLGVRDTLQNALELGDWGAANESRLRSVVTKFDQQFTKNAIDPIDPDRGDEFDPQYHEAVDDATVDDLGAKHVVRTERRGFVLGDRVIRPAQVVITPRD